MIVSHPDEGQTLNIVNDIVASLEDEGWITHTLLLSLHSSKRNQETLPYKSREGPSGSHGGFDTLDKALVVWQDPVWPTKAADEARARETGEKLRNPNIHRRVDIIIAPWRTVGCAVTGWSGGTTFQRDLRRYAKNTRGWKFDSSGIRDRANGEVMDVEGYSEYKGLIGEGRAKDMVQAEKRVFEGWGWCTGSLGTGSLGSGMVDEWILVGTGRPRRVGLHGGLRAWRLNSRWQKLAGTVLPLHQCCHVLTID